MTGMITDVSKVARLCSAFPNLRILVTCIVTRIMAPVQQTLLSLLAATLLDI